MLLPLDGLAGVRGTIVPSGLLALIVLDLGMTSGVGGRSGGESRGREGVIPISWC